MSPVPDEFYRVWIGMAFARLLKFERDVMMQALAHVMPKADWMN